MLFRSVIGAFGLLPGLYGVAVLPLKYAGLGLMLLGVVLMVAEMFTPSVGALGIGGVIAFALGATILIDTDMPAFTVDWPVIVLMAALSLGFIVVVLRLALRARRRPVVTGPEQMLGAPAREIGRAHVCTPVT